MKKVLIRGVLVRGCDQGCQVAWPCPKHDVPQMRRELTEDLETMRHNHRTAKREAELELELEQTQQIEQLGGGDARDMPPREYDYLVGIRTVTVASMATYDIPINPYTAVHLNQLMLRTPSRDDVARVVVEQITVGCIQFNVGDGSVPLEAFWHGFVLLKAPLMQPGVGARIRVTNRNPHTVEVEGIVWGNAPKTTRDAFIAGDERW